MDAILAIDINLTLDMYVTVSADSTIALRCLRTSQLWNLIPIEKKAIHSNFEVLSLKLSLHGYIVLIMKLQQRIINQVYSLNGDLLLSTQFNQNYEFKYAQLTHTED